MTMTKYPTLLEISSLNKAFYGYSVLKDVDFTLHKGEIHSIVGENGAGKSTLIKIISGYHKKDSGSIYLNGRPLGVSSPHEALATGISTVYQEINLIPHLSIAENICIGHEKRAMGLLIKRQAMHHEANLALNKIDVKTDVRQMLSSCSTALQQMTAIARCINIKASVLIFDEITSSLDATDVEKLLKVIKKLKKQGFGIIFISHFLSHIYEISDRISVLRNGLMKGTFKSSELPREKLITIMLGKDFAKFLNQKPEKSKNHKKNFKENEVTISIEGLGKRKILKPVNIQIKEGEVYGLAGLLGSGRSELARLIYGDLTPDYGSISIDGKYLLFTKPIAAIRSGFAYCAEDRKAEGIFSNFTLAENITIGLQVLKGVFHRISRKKQKEITNYFRNIFKISAPYQQKIMYLSGGNQQKALLARCLATKPRFLILDEPTRGVDIGAKLEIEKIILSAQNTGTTILFISSEMEELARCCQRIAIMYERDKVSEISSEDINANSILQAIVNTSK